MSTSSPIWMFQIDGEFFTIRPGQLILCWRNDDERQRLVDLVHAAFPAAAVFDPSDENGIRQSLGLDQLSLVHGLESFGPPTAVRDRMIRVTEQNGRISLNRLMFAGAGAVATPQGVTVDDCCDPAREDVAGGAGGGARLNPWYLNPWYLNPWYLNRILLGEPVPRPPWATVSVC